MADMMNSEATGCVKWEVGLRMKEFWWMSGMMRADRGVVDQSEMKKGKAEDVSENRHNLSELRT